MPATTKLYRIIIWAVIIGIVLLLACLSHLIQLRDFHAWGKNLDGGVLIALLILLPLAGVPMSVLSVIAGVKYGPGWGIAVVAICVAIHLMASYWLARNWLRQPVEKILKKADYKIPQVKKTNHTAVCLFVALVPGPSYTLKNYFLGLSNVPLTVLMLVGLPAHVFAISPGILFGDFTNDMTPPKIAFLVIYLLLIVVSCQWLVRRLRARAHQSSTKSTMSGR